MFTLVDNEVAHVECRTAVVQRRMRCLLVAPGAICQAYDMAYGGLCASELIRYPREKLCHLLTDRFGDNIRTVDLRLPSVTEGVCNW